MTRRIDASPRDPHFTSIPRMPLVRGGVYCITESLAPVAVAVAVACSIVPPRRSERPVAARCPSRRRRETRRRPRIRTARELVADGIRAIIFIVMAMNASLERIAVDPGILGGKPVIRGTRISVEFVLELLASGATEVEIVRDYPHLKPDDIRACLRYAASTNHDEYFVDLHKTA